MGSTSIPSIDRLWEGRTIDGKFALLEWLGGSPDSGVFVTLRQGAHRAAIKLILAEDTDAEAWLALWENVRRLSHPNLMPIHETGRYSLDGTGMVYLVTECADRVLSQFVQERPLKTHEASNIAYPVVDALSYLHAKGFVHGHVKPPNILVCGDQLKLASDSFLVAAAVPTRLGKPGAYDAPELVTANLSPAADVWSLGATLIEALTQHPLIWDPAANQPPQIPPSLPLPFAEIVPECLRLDPVARCTLGDIKARILQPPPAAPGPTPDELVARLAQLQAQAAPVQPSRPPQPLRSAPEPIAAAPVSRWKPEEPRVAAASSLFAGYDEPRRRHRSKLPLIFGVLVLLALGGVMLALTGNINLPPELAKYLPSLSPGASRPQTSAPQNTPSPSSDAPQPLTQAPVPPSTQAAPTSDSPASAAPPTSTAPSTEKSQSGPQQLVQGISGSDAAASSGADTEPSPRSPAPRPRNAPGGVLDRIIPPISPEASASMRAPLIVVLRVTVNRDGSVADASYVSPGPGNHFARVAQRAALGWKFDPPLRNGRPQTSVWRLRFYFSRGHVEVSETEDDSYLR